MAQTTPGGLVRDDPPRHRPYDWKQISQDLRLVPNEWHKVFDRDKHSYAAAIGDGDIKFLKPEHGFEYATSSTEYKVEEDGIRRRYCTLHLRYNPSKDQTRSNGKAEQ